jgi:hypothetical protein
LSHSPAVADVAPPGAAQAFDVRTLSDEEAHAFGVAVASMSFAYDGLKAENAALRRRVALQRQTIVQLRRTADADPDELLRRIGDALGESVAVVEPTPVTPQPRGTVLGAVRADRPTRRPLVPRAHRSARECADEPVAAPQVPADVEEPHVCGPGCRAACGPQSKAGPSRAWWIRQMLAPLCGTTASVGLLVGVLFLATGEYASAALTLPASGVCGAAGALLRPKSVPKRGGGR